MASSRRATNLPKELDLATKNIRVEVKRFLQRFTDYMAVQYRSDKVPHVQQEIVNSLLWEKPVAK